MAHLGAEVAAFVDGQLSPERTTAVCQHLETCDRCRAAVDDQRALKQRMTLGPVPGPPASLVTVLAAMPDLDPAEPARSRRGARWWRAGLAVVGASAAVFALAYAVGEPADGPGDPVRPDVDSYTAAFRMPPAAVSAAAPESGAASATVSASAPLSSQRLESLDEGGWPCHAQLGEAWRRVEGRLNDSDAAIRLRYVAGAHHLDLIEQRGRLDASDLRGFEQRSIDGSEVWVREGDPVIATWDADGLVFTLITDAGVDAVAQVVADLPTRPAVTLGDRIDQGLDQMASWIGAA